MSRTTTPKTEGRRGATKGEAASQGRTARSAAAGKTAADKAVVGKEAAGDTAADKAAAGKAAAGQAAAGQAATGQAATDKAATKKAASGKAASGKAASGKAAAGKATATKDAAGKPAAKAGRGRAAAKETAEPKAARRRSAKQRVLFAVSEVAPFVTTGGMGQVVSALPETLMRITKKLDVRVIAPLYQHVRQQFGAGMTFAGSVQVSLAWRSQYCGVYQVERDGVIYYFIDNEQYFDREGVYGYFDDGERFAFFSKAVLAVLELIDFVPDVIHAHDWQTALIPIYLKTIYAEKYPLIRSVFTIHNIEYQGKFPLSILEDVFDLQGFDLWIVEYQSCINLVKGAVVCCDRLTTVSPSYAEEIKETGAFGLEPIIRMNEAKLSGIINGIDVSMYDPAIDAALAQTYDIETVGKKAVNKHALQSLFGLPVEPRTPLLCMVSRLVPHKGLDLLISIMDDLLGDNVQLLILGTGDLQYELFFTELSLLHPDQVAVNIAYNPAIGTKIYAGADMMLMPSRNEPCGLSQMIACRYGTIPVARATGGLRDTIRDCRYGDGNGFLFYEYEAGELLGTIRQAIRMYVHNPEDWHNLMSEAMRSYFGWDLSAKAYAEIYKSLK